MEKEKYRKGIEVHRESIEKILEFLEDIRFGSITLIVQDGKIIQLEKNEKIRFK